MELSVKGRRLMRVQVITDQNDLICLRKMDIHNIFEAVCKV
jgi:hypothetical protein